MTFNSFPQPKPDSGGSLIKSVQRGQTNVNGVSSVTQAISSVDITKSIVKITVHGNGATVNSDLAVGAEITNPTTLTFTRSTAVSWVVVSWEVIEFTNIKSLQKGAAGLSGPSVTVAISSVNLSKSMLYFSFTTPDTSTIPSLLITSGFLSSATSMLFSHAGSGSKTIPWFVVEFP